MSIQKSVPIVRRVVNGRTELLVFAHPLAGIQLVKGSIELGETADHAAVRELHEEAGIKTAIAELNLGTWKPNFNDQVWNFWLCAVSEALPDAWEHFTQDDGGRLFKFHWHPLELALPTCTHRVYQDAVAHVRGTLQRISTPSCGSKDAA